MASALKGLWLPECLNIAANYALRASNFQPSRASAIQVVAIYFFPERCPADPQLASGFGSVACGFEQGPQEDASFKISHRQRMCPSLTGFAQLQWVLRLR